ncbi:hypothetical protein ACFXOY_33990 [Streptomyces niveus]|uniref:hypothetical protein n=1 Tax=Streptomyces niveus TaxID=193462 RepID=UPI0036CC9705
MTKTESMCVTLVSGPIAAEQRGAGPFEKHRKTFGGTRKKAHRTSPRNGRTSAIRIAE